MDFGLGRFGDRRLEQGGPYCIRPWLSGPARASAGDVLAAAKSITVVPDRESDIDEHFARRAANVQLIVRACQNRTTATPGAPLEEVRLKRP